MPDTSDPFVSISNRDVWNSLQEVKDLVRGMSAKMDSINAKVEDHDKKIRGLDLKFYGILAGLIAALGAIAIAVI